VASLVEVRDAIFPGASPLTSAARDLDARGGAVADVGWVRVMRARVPAFDALERGDLVLVPPAALATIALDDLAAPALVDALRSAAVSGVVLVGGGATAGPFAAGLEAAAIPGWSVEGDEAAEAGALERRVIGYLVNRRAELDRTAADLERRLERVALAERGLDALVAEVASTLGRAVALEDRHGAPVAVHAPSAADSATTARYAADGGRSGGALRVPLPAREGSPPPGALVLLGDTPLTELQELAAERIAPLLALALARDDAIRTARDAARRSEALPSSAPPWTVVLARQGDADRPAREALRRDVRLLAPASRLALRGDAGSLELRLVVAGGDEDADAVALVERIASVVGRPVARSRAFVPPEERPTAEAEARATLEAWERLSEVRGGTDVGAAATAPVARADRLPAYRLLVGLHNAGDARRHAEALISPLRSGNERVDRERLATLRAVLRAPGAGEAAAALGVHRNTLTYRIRRIEALTGWNLADPELRLPLLAACELVQNDQ
jgi:hypothetical protein